MGGGMWGSWEWQEKFRKGCNKEVDCLVHGSLASLDPK